MVDWNAIIQGAGQAIEVGGKAYNTFKKKPKAVQQVIMQPETAPLATKGSSMFSGYLPLVLAAGLGVGIVYLVRRR